MLALTGARPYWTATFPRTRTSPRPGFAPLLGSAELPIGRLEQLPGIRHRGVELGNSDLDGDIDRRSVVGDFQQLHLLTQSFGKEARVASASGAPGAA